MIRTRICDLLDIELPVIAAPLGPDLSGPELVAAVSNAGGLGILQDQLAAPGRLREEIRQVRDLTEKPFGANFILRFPVEDNVAVCLEERVPVLSFFWGDPARHIAAAHAAGAKVVHQVGSVAAARRAVHAGVDVVIAQGAEAGGHVEGSVATLVLVPRVVDAVTPTPVAAAGGIADARGLVAALALGADAVVLGTRFLATTESNAHPEYKRRLVEAGEQDTRLTTLFGRGWPGAPHRALRTPFVEQWAERAPDPEAEAPAVGRTRIGEKEVELLRFASLPPSRSASGDVAAMALLAGQSVGLVREIEPAGVVLRRLAAEAHEIIEGRLGAVVAFAGGCEV